jgi:hypothetical protein
MCLPGAVDFWQAEVDGEKIWADLRPNISLTPLEAYLSTKIDEVVSILPMQGAPGLTADLSMCGYHGKSRYDGDWALFAALAALVIGSEQLRLRRSYDLATWSSHFYSEEAAITWMHSLVRVTIVSAYTAMVDLTRKAVCFLQDMNPTAEHVRGAAGDQFEVDCVSADAVQGETLEYMVLALPPFTSQWSEWLQDPCRLLTIFPGTAGRWP